MKNTLEYKILKHLSDNNNGRFLDISDIESDIDFLKSVISGLKTRELILTEPYPGTPWKGDFIGISPSDKPEKCKIQLSGIEYLESLKPQPIPKDRKIYLVLFIIFSSLTVILAFLNYNSNNRNDFLNSKIDSLKIESRIYRDSIGLLKSQIELYKEKPIIDTIQTKN